MSRLVHSRGLSTLLLAVACLACTLSTSKASEILIVDRLSNTVDRYSDTGQFLGALISNDPNLNQPDGIVLSPDHTKLFVASSQNNLVMEYNYNYASGTVTNPTVFASGAQGLEFPNSMVFSPDGTKLYIANLGGDGVTQLNLDGSSAGPNITGGSSMSFSGLAFTTDGRLVAGGFDGGSVAESDPTVSSFSDLIPPDPSLQGLAGVLVRGNDLYVTGMFASTFEKYNVTTGQVDSTFTPSGGLAFPQGIIASPDGNNLLVGILGYSNGAGSIAEYSFDGKFLGTFATPVTDPSQGFVEATTMIVATPPVPPALPGDVNLDGVVNGLDISLIASNWLAHGTDEPGDANHDGVVNGLDISLVASNWLKSNLSTGAALDSAVPATAVPEPSSFMLAGTALAMLGLAARRHRMESRQVSLR